MSIFFSLINIYCSESNLDYEFKPEVVGTWECNVCGDELYNKQFIKIDSIDGYIFLITHNYFLIINASDPKNLLLAGYLKIDEANHDMALSSNYAYLSSGGGLWIIDISNKNNPFVIKHLILENTIIGELMLSDNFLFFEAYRNSNNRLYQIGIFDISKNDEPKEIKSIDFNDKGIIVYLIIFNNYLFISSDTTITTSVNYYSGYLSIYNIKNMKNPYLEYQTPISGSIPEKIKSINHYLYLLLYGPINGYSGLKIMDIYNINKPIDTGNYNFAGILPLDIKVIENYAFISDLTYGIRIFNINNNINPIQVSSIKIPESGNFIITDNQIACVISNNNFIYMIKLLQ